MRRPDWAFIIVSVFAIGIGIAVLLLVQAVMYQ